MKSLGNVLKDAIIYVDIHMIPLSDIRHIVLIMKVIKRHWRLKKLFTIMTFSLVQHSDYISHAYLKKKENICCKLFH